MVKKVTICDHTFLDHTKSASIGGDNIGVRPTHFEWEYADAQNARFVTDGDIKYARGKGQVAWLLEPRGLHPENYEIALEKDFDTILVHSYPLFRAIHKGIWRPMLYPYGGSWISFDKFGLNLKKKTEWVSILLSEKDTMPGHKLRHEIADKFGDSIDVFRGIPNKIEALASYKYSIIIESESAPYYFTEKLVDCLSIGTVPIYWGTPGLDKFFDTKGIIQVWNLKDIELALYMTNQRDYLSREKHILNNIKLARKYAICEDNIYSMYPELFV